MKRFIAVLAVSSMLGAPAFAEDITTANTTIDQLMADEDVMEILNEHIPDVVNNPQIGMAAGMTLHDIQMYAPDQITDEKLAAIDEDLAKLES